MSHCRSCGATIRWVTMQPSGKLMAVDDAPSPEGNIVVSGGKASVLSKDEAKTFKGHRFLSHFATCPDAASWRSKGDE